MKWSRYIIFIVIIAVIILVAIFYFSSKYNVTYQGLKPVIETPSQKISEIANGPLKLPVGFSISVFADNLPGARVMAMDGIGNIWVSQTGEEKITLLEIKDGMVKNKSEIFKNLKKPHGLAFDPQDGFLLYLAEEDKISRVRVYSDDKSEKIANLPSGGGHFTRTLGFGPDDRLYVSIGSSCNVCNEADKRRAAIYSMEKDGGDFKEFARGLRNAVFFTWSYIDGKMWATEMGRDNLGDDLPPDEINIIEEGAWYGWPWFYGKNIEDYDFSPHSRPQFAREPVPSRIDIPAHSAPLGLVFVPEEGWPQNYWYNLFIAYHGSWNRSEPIGYKIVRIKLDNKGNYLGTEDFITGWLTKNGALGRPVDILIQPGGLMYVTDDKAGVVYKITYKPE